VVVGGVVAEVAINFITAVAMRFCRLDFKKSQQRKRKFFGDKMKEV
jgi:hypothetical protein